MSTVTRTAPVSISRRVRNIQNHWDEAERRRRTAAGVQRRRDLVRLLTSDRLDVDLWAVGSLTPADIARLAG